jgi:hypothetical protein
MAIFLLIYVLFIIMWMVWSGVLVYHTLKYKFPDDESKIFLGLFLALSVVILIVSFIAISKADWLTIPKVFGGK